MSFRFSSSNIINDALDKLDISCPYELFNHFPIRYLDYYITEEPLTSSYRRVVLYGTVATKISSFTLASKTILSFSFISSKGCKYKVLAYNLLFLKTSLKKNQDITLVATYDIKKKYLTLIEYKSGKVDSLKIIKPVYPLTKGLYFFNVTQLMKKYLLLYKDKIKTNIPSTILEKYHLVDKFKAYNLIHFPKSYEDICQALRYFKYEEALFFFLKREKIKNSISISKFRNRIVSYEDIKPLMNLISFELTIDQKQAINDILIDLNSDKRMFRLLQGDVSSGKTIIAFISLYINYLKGYQGVLLAPSEVLAKQHYNDMTALFKKLDINISFLIADITISNKEKVLLGIKEGKIDIIIGTHALFSRNVVYKSLGLCVIDEQHRFGVKQREKLIEKGSDVDILMMSATPIPRTLAQTLCSDLDISTLKNLPCKNRNVITQIIYEDSPIKKKLIRKCIKENKRALIVAPLINNKENQYSIESLKFIYDIDFPNEVLILTGEMNSKEKNEVIELFLKGEKKILLSTTIIEVGMNIMGASLMIVYGAECFGLSTLHQLRGRIGRDGSLAHFLLILSRKNFDECERLKILCSSTNAFDIAEYDLRHRGPGNLLGEKQSGISCFTFINLYKDTNVLKLAKMDSSEIIKSNDKYNKDLIEHLKHNE